MLSVSFEPSPPLTPVNVGYFVLVDCAIVQAVSVSTGDAVFVLRRRIPWAELSAVSLSKLADNYLVLHVGGSNTAGGKGKAAAPAASTRAAAAWVPDGDSSKCMRCSAEFTLFFRRHHCRVCGLLVRSP